MPDSGPRADEITPRPRGGVAPVPKPNGRSAAPPAATNNSASSAPANSTQSQSTPAVASPLTLPISSKQSSASGGNLSTSKCKPFLFVLC